jgi:hypothetical protein
VDQVLDPVPLVKIVQGRCAFDDYPTPEYPAHRVILIQVKISPGKMKIAKSTNDLFMLP